MGRKHEGRTQEGRSTPHWSRRSCVAQSYLVRGGVPRAADACWILQLHASPKTGLHNAGIAQPGDSALVPKRGGRGGTYG